MPGNPQIITLAAYPNPFKEQTTIKYQLSGKTTVKLAIYDVFGKEVKALVDARQDAGLFEISYSPAELAEGVYYCRLQAGASVKTIRLMHVR